MVLAGPVSSHAKRHRPYSGHSLLELVAQVVRRCDRAALAELHDHRYLFHYGATGHLRLAEYVDLLRSSNWALACCGGRSQLIDQAYDLTIDKFAHLPNGRRKPRFGRPITQKAKRDGPDCRNYWAAFLEYAAHKTEAESAESELEREAMAGVILQRHVLRHFGLSCLESRRRANPLIRRFLWKIGGQTLTLWFPTEMNARECRSWLNVNIPDADPTRPFERYRIQSLIDELLVRRLISSFEQFDLRPEDITAPLPTDPAIPHGALISLRDAVAEEKAANVDLQRPAIRALGAMTVARLVRTIFDGLSDGDIQDGRLAAQFGVSKASFSRFASSCWSRKIDQSAEAAIPDLWRNTAWVLSGIPDFVAASRTTGLWDRLQQVLRRSQPPEDRP